MPYPLPSDVASVSGVTWKLIAVPDDSAYTRAALDRYSGISDVWNWGKEGVVPDSYVARQQWLTAVLLTMELWDMNPLETIIAHIDEVEGLLEAIRDVQSTVSCCGQTDVVTTTAPAEIDETDTVPQVIQTNYTTGNDWGVVWTNYFCPLLRYHWNKQIEVLDGVGSLINIGAITLSLILSVYTSAFSVFAATVFGGFTVAQLIGFVTELRTLAATVTMGTYADWNDYADDFICAVRNADGAAAKALAASDFIDTLPYSALVKFIVKLGLAQESYWQQAYAGIDVEGNEIVGLNDGLGCPTCAAQPEELNVYMDEWHSSGSHNFRKADDGTCPLWDWNAKLFTLTPYRVAGDSAGSARPCTKDTPGFRSAGNFVACDIEITRVVAYGTGQVTLYNAAGVIIYTLNVVAGENPGVLGVYNGITKMNSGVIRCAYGNFVEFNIIRVS